MGTIYWHMNGTQGGANLHPAHMKTALEANLSAYTFFEHCNYHYQKS